MISFKLRVFFAAKTRIVDGKLWEIWPVWLSKDGA